MNRTPHLDPATLRWLADREQSEADWFSRNALRADWRSRHHTGGAIERLEAGEAARVALAHRRRAAWLRNLATRAGARQP